MKDWKREVTIYKDALKKLARDIKRQVKAWEDEDCYFNDNPDLDDMVNNNIDIAKVYYDGAKRRLTREGKI